MSAPHWYIREQGLATQLRCDEKPVATFDSYLTRTQCESAAMKLNMVDAHEELVAALRQIQDIGDGAEDLALASCGRIAREALAKVQS